MSVLLLFLKGYVAREILTHHQLIIPRAYSNKVRGIMFPEIDLEQYQLYSSSSTNVVLFNVIHCNVDEKKINFQLDHCLCGVSMSSPCLCGFRLGPLVSSHILKVCRSTELCLCCSSLSECGCECPAMEGRPVQGGCLLCALSCWDRLRPSVTLNWSKQVGKNYLTNS